MEGAHSSVLLFLRHAKELRAPWELRTLAGQGHWDQVMPAFRRALAGVRGQVAAMPRLAAAWLSVLASIQLVGWSANGFACAACRQRLSRVPVAGGSGRQEDERKWWDLGLAPFRVWLSPFLKMSGCCHGSCAVHARKHGP